MYEETYVPVIELGDPDILTANLRKLGDCNPELAARVRDAELSELRLFRARSGDLGCRLGADYLTSRYAPASELDAQVEAALAQRPDLLLVFGVGLGYHLPALFERHRGRIAIYDPDPRMIRAALSRVDVSRYLDGVRVAIADRPEELNFHSRIGFGYEVNAKRAVVCLPAYKRLYPDGLSRLHDRIDVLERDNLVSVHTQLKRSREWFRHLFQNLPRVYGLPTISALAGRFADVPAIVIASGPSLNRNVHLLREAKGRALLISVGTPMKRLAAEGIVPDIAVAIEANDILYQFEGVPRLSEVHLVLCLKAHPRLFDLPCRNTLVFTEFVVDQLWAMQRLGKPLETIDAGGSVANTAFSIARLAGARTIILVGQDLAFGEGGASHADGTGTPKGEERYRDEVPLSAEHRAELAARGIELVEGYHGGLVGTRLHWLNYLLWFERKIKEAAGEGIRFINATEGGARIHGTEQVPLAQVLTEVLPPPLAEPPAERLARLCNDPPRRPLPELLALLRDDLATVKRLRREAERCAKLSGDLFDALARGRPSDEALRRALARLEKAERPFRRHLAAADSLISPLTRDEVFISTNCFRDGEDDSSDEHRALARNMNESHFLHQAVFRAAGETAPMLEALIEAFRGLAEPVKKTSATAGGSSPERSATACPDEGVSAAGAGVLAENGRADEVPGQGTAGLPWASSPPDELTRILHR